MHADVKKYRQIVVDSDELARMWSELAARGIIHRGRWMGRAMAEHADDIIDSTPIVPTRRKKRRSHPHGTRTVWVYRAGWLDDDAQWRRRKREASVRGMSMADLLLRCHVEALEEHDWTPDPDLIQVPTASMFAHVHRTWRHEHEIHRLKPSAIHAALGLAGEAGEVVDLVKKIAFKKRFTPDLDSLESELGDVGYYWAVLCFELGYDPSEVMSKNRIKLSEGHGWVSDENLEEEQP